MRPTDDPVDLGGPSIGFGTIARQQNGAVTRIIGRSPTSLFVSPLFVVASAVFRRRFIVFLFAVFAMAHPPSPPESFAESPPMSMADMSAILEETRQGLERASALFEATRKSAERLKSTVADAPTASSTPVVSRRNPSAERHQPPLRKVAFREGGPETSASRPSLVLDTPPDRLPEAGQPLLPSRSVSPSLSSRDPGDRRRGAAVKLGTFTGTNIPLEVHLAKLANCSQYYGWTEVDRLSHLKGSLEGPAATILWEAHIATEAELLRVLRSRFGTQEQAEAFRHQLRIRRRKPGESLQALYSDVCRLVALAYPGEASSLMSLVGRDAFLDSLNDADLRIRILEREPTTAEQAFRIAARYESYRVGSGAAASEVESDRRHARVVNTQQAAKDSWKEQMEATVTDLQRGIEEVRSGMQLLLHRQAAGLPPVRTAAETAVSSAASAEHTGVATKSTAEVPATTYAASKGPKRRSRDSNCFQCSQRGHFARNCPSRLQTVDRVASGTSTSAPSTTSRQVASPGVETVFCVDAVLCDNKGSRVRITPMIFDTGSNMSILPAKFCDAPVQPTNLKIYAANNTEIRISGLAHVRFKIDGILLETPVCGY
jgi:hypothetical protein